MHTAYSVMFDDVNYSLIPRDPHAVLYYINGRIGVRTEKEMRKEFPHARLLGISVTGDVPAEAYDIEQGDYTPSQAAGLYSTAKNHGIWRPCFYANMSTMPAVKASLNTIVKAREDVRLLVAEYDDIPLIPPGYDGKQFTDNALGRSLDESILLTSFFPPAKPIPTVDRTMRAVVTVDPDGGNWTISPESSGVTSQ